MSLDSSRFEIVKEIRIPNCPRITHHSRGNCDLLNTIFNEHGVLEIDRFTTHTRPFLRQLQEIHNEIDEFVYLGIEVELENFRRNFDVSNLVNERYAVYWTEKEDGSLRNNGREFVSRLGMLYEHTPIALQALEEYVTTVTGGLVEANARTGLHIHIDVSRLTVYQLANLFFIYSIFEPMIFHVSGGRTENIFCVPWETNRHTLGQITSSILRIETHPSWRWRNYSKYCGLNLSSINNYGTLEFRMHKGTYKAEEIQRWASFIRNLYLYAKRTDLIENLNRFRTKRDDYKYWDVFAEIFVPYSRQIENLPVGKREELIARCKYSTVSFFKHFVNYDNMPDSEVIRRSRDAGVGSLQREWERNWEQPLQPAFRYRVDAVQRVVMNADAGLVYGGEALGVNEVRVEPEDREEDRFAIDDYEDFAQPAPNPVPEIQHGQAQAQAQEIAANWEVFWARRLQARNNV